jgi:Tol biopolymer transport system component
MALFRHAVPLMLMTSLIVPLLLVGCSGSRRGGPNPPDLSPADTPSDDIGQARNTEDRIVFAGSHNNDGDDDIYTVQRDGSDRLRLTETTAGDRQPAWSPDHSQIVYISTRDHGQPIRAEGLEVPQRADVWIMEANGLGKRRLFAADAEKGYRLAAYPRFSPDGQTIAVVLFKENGGTALGTLNPITGTLKEITEIGGVPAWSPDGEKIAFAARPAGDQRFYVYVVGKDGADPKQISKPQVVGNRPGNARYDAHTSPVWTPDGTAILYSGTLWKPGETPDAQPTPLNGLYRIPAEGGEATAVTQERDYGAVFSPQGDRLVFTRFPKEPPATDPQRLGSLYTSLPDGTNAQQIITDLAVEASDW